MKRVTSKPTVRVVRWSGGELVAAIYGDCLTLRPLRARAELCQVTLLFGALYVRALDSRINAELREKRLTRGKKAVLARLSKRGGR